MWEWWQGINGCDRWHQSKLLSLSVNYFEAFGGDKHFKVYGLKCCNSSFRLATNARVYEGAGQKWSPGVTCHAPGSVGKCEGMNPHTPKWAPTLGIGVPMDFWIFKERLQGSKLIGLRIFYIIGKMLELKCLKWACMIHLDISNTSYGQKKGRESNWQFDSRALKVKNRLNFFVFR
jgi:hypothetical protein